MAIKDPESLTDRVAALEKRIEEGNFSIAATVSAGDTQERVIRKDIKMPEAPKAVPDDIRKLIECWPQVISDCANDMSGVKMCKPVLGDDGKLILYFPAGDMNVGVLNNEKPHSDLAVIFENHTGAQVDFEIKETESEEMFEDGLYDLRNMVKPGALNKDVPIETEENTEDY